MKQYPLISNKFSMALIISLVAAANSSLKASVEVIYGDDDRIDVYETPNSLYAQLAQSTAAMIKNRRLVDNGTGEVQIKGKPLKDRGICRDERFSEQLTAADCSGFLVSENLLVTAGHCIRGKSSCDNYKWVFDFKVDSRGQYGISVPKNSVYACKRVVSRALDNWSKNDYALIELDRPADDRRPLAYRKSGKARVGDNLVVIGHPSGLPAKIADGARVRALKGMFFTANLDTYGGNSGSAVFNASTGIVEGILVRGEKDYVHDRAKGCKSSYQISNHQGRGEDVTYIGNIPELSSLD